MRQGWATLANELCRDPAPMSRFPQTPCRRPCAAARIRARPGPGWCTPSRFRPVPAGWRPRSGGYWANCLYCACGIAAAMRCRRAYPHALWRRGQAVTFHVADGALVDTGDVFHLSTPAAQWWDNVIFACASFPAVQDRGDAVDDWCRRHALPKGAVLSLPQLWDFARDWYGGYLTEPWRKRSAAEAEDVFRRHGLSGPFWTLG